MSKFSADVRGRTPKKKKRRSTAHGQSVEDLEVTKRTENEEPVVVVSPAVSGPLQGSARVVKDHCADWHNYINKWNDLNDQGREVINKIVTSKLQTKYGKSSEVASMQDKGPVGIAADSHDIAGSNPMPDGLEELCCKLTKVYTSMNKLASKMSAITRHLRGVLKMERSLSGTDDSQPLFQTWPVKLFVEASTYLEGMYTKELALKKAITEDVAHANSRDVLMTYTSSWLHQPYIDGEATTTVESMLRETGHR